MVLRPRRLDVAFGPLVPATLLERPNRFLVVARIRGRRAPAACRDPGRLRELLVPGARLLLARAPRGRRRTRYTVVLARHGRSWVSVIPALANEILAAALARGSVPGLSPARILAREVVRGHSRFDFLLEQDGRALLTEVKSATLVARRRALFPDAPTRRGTRHLQELTARSLRGAASLLVFVVQRADARSLSPCREIDPAFADALARAARAGVGVLAYACRVSGRGCALDRRIPVVLG